MCLLCVGRLSGYYCFRSDNSLENCAILCYAHSVKMVFTFVLFRCFCTSNIVDFFFHYTETVILFRFVFKHLHCELHFFFCCCCSSSIYNNKHIELNWMWYKHAILLDSFVCWLVYKYMWIVNKSSYRLGSFYIFFLFATLLYYIHKDLSLIKKHMNELLAAWCNIIIIDCMRLLVCNIMIFDQQP